MFAAFADLTAILLPVVAAWLWIGRFCALPGVHRLAAAIGLGAGAASVLLCAWRPIGQDPRMFAVLDASVWVMAAAVALRQPRYPTYVERGATGRWFVATSGVVLLALAIPLAAAELAAAPNGAWDAWAIWNLRARFLTAPDGAWVNAFSDLLLWSHPDYPLLLPASIARGWLLVGGPEAWVPAVISIVFLLGAALTVGASLFERRGAAASVTGLALLAVPTFIEQGAGQMADIAVGFYAVLAFTLLARPRESGADHILAGTCLGLAAWTKNEGLALSAIVLATSVWAEWRSRDRQSAMAVGVSLLTGLAPILIVVAIFKFFVAPENDLVAGFFAPGVLAYWYDEWRLRFVATYMLTTGMAWGGWPFGSPVWPVLLMAAWPVSARRGHEPAATAAGFALLLLVMVFAVVYVMTPHSVAWHLQTSWHRLIAQLWPTLVWWAAMRWFGRAPGMTR